MNWWLLVTFLAGWLACWKLSGFLLRTVLRRGNSLMVDSLSGLPQDSLIKVRAVVETELAKRRGEQNQERDPASAPKEDA